MYFRGYRYKREEGMTLAERLFDGWSDAKGEIEWTLFSEGVTFEKIDWNKHDKSITLYGVPRDGYSLKIRTYFRDAGFSKVFINYRDIK